MKWLMLLLGTTLLFTVSAKAHWDRYLCHHYYYDEHGFMVIVPVFHDWDHPHAIHGITLIHIPVVHHTHGIHTIHKHGHKTGGKHYHRHRPARHFHRGH